jgi:DNA polymerase III sliding clamp (beta) subunit (PCNA family)
VLRAAGSDLERPVLTCVLIEAKDDSLRLVATDSFRLAVRDLVSRATANATFRTLVPAATLRRRERELPEHGDVAVHVDGDEAVFTSDGLELRLPGVPATYPDYEPLLGRDGAAQQFVAGRVELLKAFNEFTSEFDAVSLEASMGSLTLRRDDQSCRVPADYTGPGFRVALNPAFAADALEAAVGPEVALEVIDDRRPVVFRSADNGTLTTMVMPVLLACA